MKKFFFSILILSIFISLLLPLLVFGRLELEQVYPTLPGVQTITVKSTLGQVVKYFVSLAILLAGLAAVASLIISGFKYLTSTGAPEKMKEARNQIFASFFGLLILLASYLILVTINPQLTVLYVKREPVESGIVLLTEEGKNKWDVLNPTLADAQSIGELYPDNARFLTSGGITDAEKVFGDLVKTSGKVNFEDFPVEYLVFWKTAKRAPFYKVIVFDKNGYRGDSFQIAAVDIYGTEYFNDSAAVSRQTAKQLAELFESRVKFKENNIEKEEIVKHPPLSFKVIGIGPGVYLTSETEDEIYETHPRNDLGESDLDFNDKTLKISIQNKDPDGSGEYDYLAILFKNTRQEGEFRLFFEKKDRGGKTVGNIDPAGSSIGKGTTDLESRHGPVDQYGKIEKNNASSIYIGQLAESPEVCKKVKICTGRGYFGECLVYLPPGKFLNLDDPSITEDKIQEFLRNEGATEKEGNYYLATKPMPLYTPENIPNNVKVRKLKEDNTTIEEKNADFHDKIYSLEIDGNCLVALFDHSIDESKIDTCDKNNNCWDGGGPGGNSEAFIESVANLDSNNITSCHPIRGLNFLKTISCASSIAVYPLK